MYLECAHPGFLTTLVVLVNFKIGSIFVFETKKPFPTLSLGGKKKVSVDRAQVGMLGKAINILVFGGNMPRDITADIKEFRDKKRRGNIDIWWLFDDGGMPVLLGEDSKAPF